MNIPKNIINDADFGIYIELVDLTTKSVKDTKDKRTELKSGIIGGPHGLTDEELKSINIKRYADLAFKKSGISIEGVDFGINLETFNSGATYVTDQILAVKYLNTLTRLVNITFTDGSVWSDGEIVYFLTYTNNDVKWKLANQLVVGDSLIAVDLNNETSFFADLKTVQSIETKKDFFTGWVISVENDHLFIVKDTTHNNTFALFFVHNWPLQNSTYFCE